MSSSTDRIERKVRLEAPRSRVWRALTDSREFGRWFGATLDDPFVAGKTARGRITIPGYDHLTLELEVGTIEPERYFTLRWHPYAVETGVDYSKEPTTLIEFTLDDAGDKTDLTIVESGFDAIPASRRAKAFQMNSAGWEGQLRNIARYLAD